MGLTCGPNHKDWNRLFTTSHHLFGVAALQSVEHAPYFCGVGGVELFFWSWSAPKQALVERSDQRSTHVTLSLTTANHSHKQNQMISPKDMLLKPIYRCLANDKNTLPLSIQPKYPQGHAAFTTLLHLDATFAMIP